MSPLYRIVRLRGTSALALALTLGLTLVSSTALASDAPGKAVFTAQACNKCHAVKAEGITSDGDGPDLSKVGATLDAATIEKFITKQAELNGKKHKKKYQGSDDDLKKLVAWLAALK